MSLKCKLALSTCGLIPDDELFSSYSENGVEAVELSLSLNQCDEL